MMGRAAVLSRGLTFQQEAAGLRGIHTLTAFFPSRLRLDRNPPSRRTCGLEWPGIYQNLRCHEVTCASAIGEKPYLSVIGSDLFNLHFLVKEQEGSEAAQKEHLSHSSFRVWAQKGPGCYFLGKFFFPS